MASERERHFVQYLQSLATGQDRAALARLRRGLGKAPGESADLHRHVVPFLSPIPDHAEETAYYLVASLFGLYPEGQSSPGVSAPANLGASLAGIAADVPGVERRFVSLLNAHVDDLSEHLRQEVGLLRAHAARLDWAQLLTDIRSWDAPTRFVQRAWARSFWGGRALDTPIDAASTGETGGHEDASVSPNESGEKR